MNQIKLFKQVTDKVWIALLAWIGLAGISNLIRYFELDKNILGQAIGAILELAGLLLFIEALYKWVKYRKSSKDQKSEADTKSKFPFHKILIGVFIIALIYFAVQAIADASHKNNERKYIKCMLECEDAGLTKTQDSVCKVDCIKKYK